MVTLRVKSMKISVVIPTHNRLAGLKNSLASLLRQTVLPDEVVVVDDGSQEPVPEAVFDSFPAGVKVKLLRNEKPMGGNNARNLGVLASTSDYIAFLDDDDAFKSNKIEELKKAVFVSNQADIIYHPAHIHMINEGVSYFSKPKAFKDGEDVFRQLLVGNVIGGTPMVTIKRQSLVDVGLFDEEMPALQDYELWLRMAKAGASFYFLDKALTDYEQKTKAASITKSDDAIRKARSLLGEKYFGELSEVDLRKLSFSWMKSDVLRALLNDEMGCSFKLSMQYFMLTKKMHFIFAALASLLGRKLFFRAYVITRMLAR